MKHIQPASISIPIIAAFIFAVALFIVSPAEAQNMSNGYKETFHANLTGSEEVPPVSTSMNGHTAVKVSNDEQSVWYELHVFNGNDVTAAHFHCAPRGVNGPVVVPLFTATTSTTQNGTGTLALDVNGLLSSGTITASSLTNAAQTCNPSITSLNQTIQAMRDGQIYVNVHTISNPNGEIRGQVQHGRGNFVFPQQSGTTSTSSMGTTSTSTGTSTQMTREQIRSEIQHLINRINDLLSQLFAM